MSDKQTVKLRKLNENATLPTYAHSTDAGFDLYAADDVVIEPGETKIVPTGLALSAPEGHEIQIRPRSGVTLRTKLRVQLGTVDAGYTGEVGVIVDNAFEEPWNTATGGMTMVRCVSTIDEDVIITEEKYPLDSYLIRKGDRIAQGVLAPVTRAEFSEVETLGDSERGEGGYGSTGTSEYRKFAEAKADEYEGIARLAQMDLTKSKEGGE